MCRACLGILYLRPTLRHPAASCPPPHTSHAPTLRDVFVLFAAPGSINELREGEPCQKKIMITAWSFASRVASCVFFSRCCSFFWIFHDCSSASFSCAVRSTHRFHFFFFLLVLCACAFFFFCSFFAFFPRRFVFSCSLFSFRGGMTRHGSLRSTPTTWRRAPAKTARRMRPWVSNSGSRSFSVELGARHPMTRACERYVMSSRYTSALSGSCPLLCAESGPTKS